MAWEIVVVGSNVDLCDDLKASEGKSKLESILEKQEEQFGELAFCILLSPMDKGPLPRNIRPVENKEGTLFGWQVRK